MYDVVIVGAGGLGREMLRWSRESLSQDAYRVKGFLSNNPRDLDGFGIDLPILGNPEEYVPEENDRFVFAIGLLEVKRQIIDCLKRKSAKFLTVVHPTAQLAETATLGEGVIICPFATVSEHARIGDFAMLQLYASCGHDTQVGKHCILCPYATLNGFAVLEDEVFLATHATVTPSCRVGHHSKVSANSVVTRDVAPHSLVYGVPGQHRVLWS